MRLPWLIAVSALPSLLGAGETYAFRAPAEASATVEAVADGVLEVRVSQRRVRSLPENMAELTDGQFARGFAQEALFRFLGGKSGEIMTCQGLTLVSAEAAEGRFLTRWTVARAACALAAKPPPPTETAKPNPTEGKAEAQARKKDSAESAEKTKAKAEKQDDDAKS